MTNMVEDSEINSIICENKGAELEVIVKKLIDEANENGGLDNIAVVLAEV